MLGQNKCCTGDWCDFNEFLKTLLVTSTQKCPQGVSTCNQDDGPFSEVRNVFICLPLGLLQSAVKGKEPMFQNDGMQLMQQPDTRPLIQSELNRTCPVEQYVPYARDIALRDCNKQAARYESYRAFYYEPVWVRGWDERVKKKLSLPIRTNRHYLIRVRRRHSPLQECPALSISSNPCLAVERRAVGLQRTQYLSYEIPGGMEPKHRYLIGKTA
jgi:hypothetical protein